MRDQRNTQLGEAFRNLRAEEHDSVPPFRRPSTEGKVRGLGAAFRPVAVGAMVVIAAGLGIVFAPSDDRTQDRDGGEIATVDYQLGISQMPTDFLLETPSADLMTSTPRFTLSTPTFENQEGTVR